MIHKPTGGKKEENPDLFIFGDSNPNGFRAVAYAMFYMENGSKQSNRLISKAKLVPIVTEGRYLP